MSHITILPRTIGEEPVIIPVCLPHDRQALIIPGSSIYVGTLSVRCLFNSRKKNTDIIRQNITPDILYDPQTDLILPFPQKGGEELVFLIVSESLWKYWMMLCRTRLPEFRRLLPDWMLLPSPREHSCSLLLEDRIISRQGARQGVSLPPEADLGAVQLSWGQLQRYPLCRQRFLQDRPVLRLPESAGCVLTDVRRSGRWVMTVLSALLVCQLVLGLIVRLYPVRSVREMGLPPYARMLTETARLSDTIPMTLNRLQADPNSARSTLHSDTDCTTLRHEISTIFPSAKILISLQTQGCNAEVSFTREP